jgi:large subunit ribosomal protein L16
MGSGKGAPEYWMCRIHPGRILFEVDGVTEEMAREAFSLAAAKLPLKTKFIKRLESE